MLFNEPKLLKLVGAGYKIAEIERVSVLFNEPKLLKYVSSFGVTSISVVSFSALQRAEIAEIYELTQRPRENDEFQCSSTSRNC